MMPCLISGVNKAPTPIHHISTHHVAQDMAALCSLAFMRKVAILEDLRSGSMFRSYVLMPAAMPGDPPNRLPMWACPTWPPGLGTPRKSDTPLAEWGWGVIQGVTVSQGTTQPGTGDAALLPPIQDGFWIWNIDGRSTMLESDKYAPINPTGSLII